jgi:hypothetical protein
VIQRFPHIGSLRLNGQQYCRLAQNSIQLLAGLQVSEGTDVGQRNGDPELMIIPQASHVEAPIFEVDGKAS